MESIVYSTVWREVEYIGGKFPRLKKDLDCLGDWRKGTWKDVRRAKRGFLAIPDTIFGFISDEIIEDFCTYLSGIILSRHLTLEAHHEWERRAEKLNAGRIDLTISGLNHNISRPMPVEPPIPSKALLPEFLDTMRIEKSWVCSRDCCQTQNTEEPQIVSKRD